MYVALLYCVKAKTGLTIYNMAADHFADFPYINYWQISRRPPQYPPQWRLRRSCGRQLRLSVDHGGEAAQEGRRQCLDEASVNPLKSPLPCHPFAAWRSSALGPPPGRAQHTVGPAGGRPPGGIHTRTGQTEGLKNKNCSPTYFV